MSGFVIPSHRNRFEHNALPGRPERGTMLAFPGSHTPAGADMQAFEESEIEEGRTGAAVLIVEDEQCIRDVLEELFDVEGTRVTVAASLPEALSALRSRTFDLIVTDLRLGGQRDGGLQVMATAGLLAGDAAVIVLTAFPDDENRHASNRLGATHFLEKPVDLATIASLAAQHGVFSAIIPAAARTM